MDTNSTREGICGLVKRLPSLVSWLEDNHHQE